MALSKSTITGRVPLPTDENLQFAELTFALSGLDTEGASVLPGGVSTRAVLVGSDIPAGFELWQNTAGLRGTHYRVLARWTVKDRDGVRDQYADLGIIQVGSDPSYTLADLINNGVPPAIGTFWSAITQAQYDAVIQAAADALASAVAAALYDGPRFGTIALMQAGTGFADGKFVRVDTGANGEQEGFVYDAASTLTADGALIVAATGMGGGRLISTRSVYASWAEMDADVRALADSTVLTYNGYRAETVSSGGITLTGGLMIKPLPFAEGKYHVAQMGALGGVADVTAPVASLISIMPAGSELHFDGTKSYVLNISAHKEISLVGNGATLIDADISKQIIAITGDPANTTAHAVTETTLNYGDKTFTVVGASGLFTVGDIGTLHDGSLRPSDDQPVNFLVVKIKSVVGDVVTVDGFIMSYMGTNAITFIHNTDQLKDVAVRDFKLRPRDTNLQIAAFLTHIERPAVSGIEVKGNTGNGVGIRYSYDLRVGDNTFGEPPAAASGQGYGLALYACSEGFVGQTSGIRCRHALDIDSTYGMDFGLVTDGQATSIPLGIAHNGFAGHNTFVGFKGGMDVGAYAVGASDQGFGVGANRADKVKHPLRKVHVELIEVVMFGLDPNAASTPGAYFTTHVDGVTLGKVDVRIDSATALTSGGQSAAVRLDGALFPGGLHVGTIITDKIARPLVRIIDNGYTGPVGEMSADNIIVTEKCDKIAWMRGGGTLRIGRASAAGVTGSNLITAEVLGATKPTYVDIGPVKYTGTDTQILETSAGIEGRVAPTQRSYGVALPSPSGATFTKIQIQNRSGAVKLVGATGSGTDAITDFPAPDLNGQEILVYGKFSGRNDVTIPAAVSLTGAVITFNTANPVRRLVGVSDKWLSY